jgi:hypothetical protein
MVAPKTSNSSKRGTIVKYNIPLKNNDLNKALKTLGNNVETISRQEAVATKPTGGHKKAAMSYGALVGQPAFIQKSFDK